MEWVPFFQTVLWVSLIAGTLWWFRAEVKAVLEAIRERIRGGDAFETPFLKMPSSPPAQPPTARVERLKDETQLDAGIPVALTARAKPLLAEDLAFRELQAEFGVSINRQVRLATDVNLDGMFVSNGGAYGVEVKYLTRPPDAHLAESAVGTLLHVPARMHWRRFTPVLVVVCDYAGVDEASVQDKLSSVFEHVHQPPLIRAYSLTRLLQKYDAIDDTPDARHD